MLGAASVAASAALAASPDKVALHAIRIMTFCPFSSSARIGGWPAPRGEAGNPYPVLFNDCHPTWSCAARRSTPLKEARRLAARPHQRHVRELSSVVALRIAVARR